MAKFTQIFSVLPLKYSFLLYSGPFRFSTIFLSSFNSKGNFSLRTIFWSNFSIKCYWNIWSDVYLVLCNVSL